MGEWAFPFADVDGDRMYSDTDFSTFYAHLFTNGVFATVGTALQIRESASLGMRIRVGSGGATINGRQYLNTEESEMTIPIASALQDREDSVVIRLNLSDRTMKLFYKQADVSVVRTDTTYEMQLARIKVARNITQIKNVDITDTRADPKVCGYSSPFQKIETGDLLAQFKSELEANGVLFEDWFAQVKADYQVYLTDAQNYIGQGKVDFQSWVDSVKEIIEAVDPGGELLSQFNTLKQTTEKYIPTGFTFIIEHNSEYQPDIKVTTYKNALGTEVNGLGTGPIFGRERLYNVPVNLSYDRQKAYIEMPTSYKIGGDITIVDDETLLIIDKPQTLCFKITGAKITKGYIAQ